MNDNSNTLCEGCTKPVPMEDVAPCPYCELDPLCNDCRIAGEHACPGKPGKPGTLTLEVGQRVQDKFQLEKTEVGRIDEIDGDIIYIVWRQPSLKSAVQTKTQASSLLENSELPWHSED